MRIKPFLVTIIIVTIFYLHVKNAVQLEYTNAKGEVHKWAISFSVSINPDKDSLLNVWDSTDYISFSQNSRSFSAGKARSLVFPAVPLTSHHLHRKTQQRSIALQ
jgi:hypothetical protein